jgi:tRNA dimethylallyltransferase
VLRDREAGLPVALCVMGPTASGKTDLALGLCNHLDCEIISVDSAQVYRGMDIGTAKPSREVLSRYPHRLIDIRDPAEPYSAAAFRHDALHAIEEILAAGRTPLLVGGTMLYFRALRGGLSDLPAANPAVRAHILAHASRFGWPAVHRRLRSVDPEAAARIHPNDPQRLQRALEVYMVSGWALSRLQSETAQATSLPCRLLQLAVAPSDRGVLHARIAARFDAMLQAGFVEEVRTLHARPDLHPVLPSMRSVGYRQLWDFLSGQLSYEGARERAIAQTRQLAKRQLTWLRSWPDLQWIETVETAAVAGNSGSLRAVLERALIIVRRDTI